MPVSTAVVLAMSFTVFVMMVWGVLRSDPVALTLMGVLGMLMALVMMGEVEESVYWSAAALSFVVAATVGVLDVS